MVLVYYTYPCGTPALRFILNYYDIKENWNKGDALAWGLS